MCKLLKLFIFIRSISYKLKLILFLVKQDLVYEAMTGNIIGFTDIGERSNKRSENELATHALTGYVKSFFGNPGLKYPLAYFAISSVTGPQLSSILWETIALLEHFGLQVSKYLSLIGLLIFNLALEKLAIA